MGIVVSAGIASQLLPKFGARPITFVGLLMATSGMYYLTKITATSEYPTHILPALIVMSLGMGMVFVPLSATALFGVTGHDMGVASAVLNTAQQIGGSLGTALLNTIAATATANYLVDHQLRAPTPDALVSGFTAAFSVGAGLLGAAAIVWISLINTTKNTLSQNDVPAHIG